MWYVATQSTGGSIAEASWISYLHKINKLLSFYATALNMKKKPLDKNRLLNGLKQTGNWQTSFLIVPREILFHLSYNFLHSVIGRRHLSSFDQWGEKNVTTLTRTFQRAANFRQFITWFASVVITLNGFNRAKLFRFLLSKLEDFMMSRVSYLKRVCLKFILRNQSGMATIENYMLTFSL